MSGARISQPSVTFTNVAAQIPISNAPQQVLMVGIKNASGTAIEKELIEIDTTDAYKTLFGNSQLTDMIDVFKQTNSLTKLDVIAINPPTGSAATHTMTVTGTATEPGELILYYNTKNNPVKVSVANNDDNVAVATAIKTNIQNATNLPVSAENVDGVVTVTYRYEGTEGNDGQIMIEGEVNGITIALTEFTNGAGTPTFDTTFFDVVSNERYQTVVWPFPDQSDVIKTFLEPRWNVTNNVLDGVSITTKQTSLTTALTDLDAMNEKTAVYFVNAVNNTRVRKGGAIFAMPHVLSASVAAFRSFRYTEDALLTPYLTTSAGLDQFGGPALGALPYFNTLFPFLPTLEKGTGFTEIEVEQLSKKGGSVLGNNKTGTDIICGEIHTTYKTDPAGNVDPTYHYLNNVDVQSIAREYFFISIPQNDLRNLV